MTFGDIYLVEIPASGGHEQQGVRPAIVVQTSENIEKVPTVLVVPFTTQIKAANFPFTFLIEPAGRELNPSPFLGNIRRSRR